MKNVSDNIMSALAHLNQLRSDPKMHPDHRVQIAIVIDLILKDLQEGEEL